MPDLVKQNPDNLRQFDFFEFRNGKNSETISIYNNGKDDRNPENNKQHGQLSVFRKNASGQYDRITDTKEAQGYLDAVIAYRNSLPSTTGSRSTSPESPPAKPDSNKSTISQSSDQSWTSCGAKKNPDVTTKPNSTPKSDSQTIEKSNETQKSQPQNQEPKPSDNQSLEPQKAEKKPQTQEVKTDPAKDDSSNEHPYPELKTNKDGTPEDSASAVRAALKEGGIDLDNQLTRLSLTKDMISELSYLDRMRVMSNPMKISETLAEVLSEKDPITKNEKAQTVLENLFLKDPVKASAVALMCAEGSSKNKKDLESLAGSFYESGTRRITDPKSLREFTSMDKRINEKIKTLEAIPRHKLTDGQKESLKMANVYLNLPEYYRKTDYGLFMLRDIQNFYSGRDEGI
jgi:hypothetical protein